jgi:phosphoribosylanthranilate isomerase
MTAVKICGITREEDARAAAGFGASFIGFVLWSQSPRAVTLDRVRAIVMALPSSITPVGVFVDPSAEQINEAAAAGIKVAQIHGTSETWRRGITAGVDIVRAVHLASGDSDGIEPNVSDRRILLDAQDPVRHGGTGRKIDWSRARLVAAHREVILAGGLTPDNVRRAITEVRPFAVDVSSGVELRPGVKNHARMRAFIEAATGTGT